MIRFTVLGRPQPGGSKRAFALRTGGQFTGRVAVADANPNVKSWRAEVRHVARAAYEGPLLTGPVEACFVFYKARPAAHFRTGRNSSLLRAAAPEHPTSRPDALKLARAVEDALTGVIWRDDSQVVHLHAHKAFGEPERCEIEITPL